MSDSERSQVASPPLLRAVEIEELFGRFSYRVKVGNQAGAIKSATDRLVLLYGDNGSGKTTVLQMIWHILSSAADAGHRTAIARVPFRKFVVEFDEEMRIEATKTKGLVGSYSIVVQKGRQRLCEVDYDIDDTTALTADALALPADKYFDYSNNTLKLYLAGKPGFKATSDDDREFIAFLKALGVSPLFLADDRNIYNDDLLAEHERLSGRQSWDSPMRIPESAKRVIAHELSTCIDRVNDWLRQLTLGGQTQGSVGANSIYLQVVGNLATEAKTTIEAPATELERRVQLLGDRTKQFEELGLVPHFAADDFLDLLPKLRGDRRQIAEEVLVPYLDSLQARLDALQDAETLIRTFLDQVNSFLVGKNIDFHPRRGIKIQSDDGMQLLPTMLSSGERQLILLLCNTMLARRSSRLFIIDEPELSLNVKWQRSIIDALLACTEGSDVQFIVATHSVEIVTGHMENLAQLGGGV